VTTAEETTDSPEVLPGTYTTLGAVPGDGGVNFAVASAVAQGVTLCLFDADGKETQVELPEFDSGVWHGFVPGLEHGQAYGYRVKGPFNPGDGVRCNPAKLLLDPYARAIAGEVEWNPALNGGEADNPSQPDGADSAPYMPKSLVVDAADYDWEGDKPPGRSYAESIYYEVHVKGFTARHPDVPEEIRGTYAGMAHPAATEYLRDLGITAVELLPVHEHVNDGFLMDKGLTNYWGYNTIGFFAPEQAYSAAARQRPGGQVNEFRDMVKAMHKAGIEVILDVVYNHTAEGSDQGPTLSFRGLDNAAYYRLVPGDASSYYDTTGTGNSLDANNPVALRMIMDSLRYWVSEMHVDGFRFDLAATLGREDDNRFDRYAAFFQMVAQDPVISSIKLIAEPWDVGQADSYDLGRFPVQWREWNGRYRDLMRDYWRTEPIGVSEFATRFAGSADLYQSSRRGPTASVNMITVHDGFTLRDLVSYDNKHNEANGENNRDGSTDNRSWNCGVEGPTDDPEISALRMRQSRALLSTLLLSFGMPLILGGDEIGRTQGGNNNTYCQDNEISWFDWENADRDLRGYVKRLIALRTDHPVFRRKRFLAGAESSELSWFSNAGVPVTHEQWADPNMHAIAVYLDGSDAPDDAADGTPQVDDDFLILVNAFWEDLQYTIPKVRSENEAWFVELDSYDSAVSAANAFPQHTGDQVKARARSVVVLRAPRPESDPDTDTGVGSGAASE
jgi:isoamylase